MRCYDYQCPKCGHTWDHYQDSWEETDNCKECPKCGEKAPTRLIGSPTVHCFYSPCHPRHKRGMCKDRSKYAPKKDKS